MSINQIENWAIVSDSAQTGKTAPEDALISLVGTRIRNGVKQPFIAPMASRFLRIPERVTVGPDVISMRIGGDMGWHYYKLSRPTPSYEAQTPDAVRRFVSSLKARQSFHRESLNLTGAIRQLVDPMTRRFGLRLVP